jgi:hypothetical protein
MGQVCKGDKVKELERVEEATGEKKKRKWPAAEESHRAQEVSTTQSFVGEGPGSKCKTWNQGGGLALAIFKFSIS